jgi:hypothetical protein
MSFPINISSRTVEVSLSVEDASWRGSLVSSGRMTCIADDTEWVLGGVWRSEERRWFGSKFLTGTLN